MVARYSYNVDAILSNVYGLHWSCVARPTSVQNITTSNINMHGRGCGHTNMELHVVVSANVSNSYNNLFVQLLNCS